jgi:Starch-binding associating with outer membrane/Susd and RagB outer membrane lipoprotein
MKIYKKIALTLCVVIASSCTLDLREDPNAVQPDEVLPSLLLNTMQTQLAGFFNAASSTGMNMTRLQNAGSSLYRTSVTPEGFNGLWTTAYAGILEDAETLIAISDANGYARHAGMARIIEAYTLITLVDFFGDVPYSEAFQGSANFNPKLDDGAEIYTLALSLLDQAKLDLSTQSTVSAPPGYLNPVAPTLTDLYYGYTGTVVYTKWIKLANSLKLKINVNLGDATAINALIADVSATGLFLNTADENFIFRYGTNTADPDTRHPSFVAQYPAGGGAYQANWLMWHMFHGYDAVQNGAGFTSGDPRMRFYFYRQVTANSTSTNEIRCLTESLPSHYPSSTGAAIKDATKGGRPPMGTGVNHPTNDPADPAWNRTFCYPTNSGYWGRDHVDPQGIPPDNNLRTAWGAYPVGGRFDNNSGAAVAAGLGMRGAGIQPILMRCNVQFLLAEAALTLSTTGVARTYYQNGIDYSMSDVKTWSTTGTLSTSSVAASPNEAATINAFYPNASTGTFTASVRVATTANLALTGNPTVDGVALVDGDRILVKNQTTAAENGIYVVAAAGWTRATDADASVELVNLAVKATSGTISTNRRWVQTTAGPITVGTTSIAWAVNNSYQGDAADYLISALAAFDNRLLVSATEALNYVAREHWIASFGNGVEAYNLYRRTGLPTGMQPVINPQPGIFPRSFWYPANAANLNNKIDQKADLSGKVFWDSNSTDLDF